MLQCWKSLIGLAVVDSKKVFYYRGLPRVEVKILKFYTAYDLNLAKTANSPAGICY